MSCEALTIHITIVDHDPCICTINNPCVNGGVCISNGDSHRCSCPLYYTGYNCEGTHANTQFAIVLL